MEQKSTGETQKRKKIVATYDIHLNDDKHSKSFGWKCAADFCKTYLKHYTQSDFSGGIAQIVCNETGKVVYQVKIK